MLSGLFICSLVTFQFNSDVFCSGGAHFSDGRVISIGGYAGNVDLMGVRFISNGGDWQENDQTLALKVPRWYMFINEGIQVS